MPSVAVTLYSVFFKLVLKHRLQSPSAQTSDKDPDPFGITCRADEATSPPNPSFSSPDGVATKDIHIDPLSSPAIRIFLPSPNLTKKVASVQKQQQNESRLRVGTMPELPEVEAARCALQAVCVGRRIKRCAVAPDSVVIPDVSPLRLESALTGRSILEARRKGKNLWLRLDEPPFPSFQFG